MISNLSNSITGLKVDNPNLLSENYTEKKTAGSHFFFVKNGTSLSRITFDAIIFITVEGQYCRMITEKGRFLLQTSLNQLMEKLPTSQFLRSHRNFIVNLKKIDVVYLEDNLIVLDNKEEALLSRKFKGEFIKKCDIVK